jgi:hypothetical protein
MDPTQTSTAGQFGAAIPADAAAQGASVYDQIMAEIEPDLLTNVIPTLETKYAGETPEQAAARSQRYDAAFAEYDKRYAVRMTQMDGQVHTLQKTVRTGIETDERHGEEDTLTTLESTISSL